MSTRPERMQRKRTKGWKMPPNTVYVGRPTKWGNPFRKTPGASPAYLVLQFRMWLGGRLRKRPSFAMLMQRERLIHGLDELRGKNLACWCPLDQPCHADVLLKIANGGTR